MRVRPLTTTSESDLPANIRRIDALENALCELYFVAHPQESKTDPRAAEAARDFSRSSSVQSVWVIYPWRSVAIRIPDEDTFYTLRTARNRGIITADEQLMYRDSRVGIAGLSVGSAVVSALVSTGGPKNIRIADPDTIEITNLNRMRATLPDVGLRKTEVAAKLIWETDPFADVDAWESGANADTVGEFVRDCTVVIDEMDNIAMKIALREAAKKARIPVVMATDNGDGAIVDVERFDIEPERHLFHGRISLDVPPGQLSREKFTELAARIIDESYFTERQGASHAMVGKTLSGVPQLGTAAAIAGASAAHAVRLITTGQPLPSGRYVVSPERAILEIKTA